jgi:hypothetical protein
MLRIWHQGEYMVRTEQEIRAYLKELQGVYDKAASPAEAGRKPAHMVALARVIRDKIDVLNWVMGEEK